MLLNMLPLHVFFFFFFFLANGRAGRGEQARGAPGVRQVPLHQGDRYRSRQFYRIHFFVV